jgi:enolase
MVCHLTGVVLGRRVCPQDDWDSYVAFTPGVTKDLQVVGDDLTVTNPKKIKEAAEKGCVRPGGSMTTPSAS